MFHIACLNMGRGEDRSLYKIFLLFWKVTDPVLSSLFVGFNSQCHQKTVYSSLAQCNKLIVEALAP
jgi:hypothetical protein